MRFEFLNKSAQSTCQVTDVVVLVNAVLIQGKLESFVLLDEFLSPGAEVALEP